MLIKRVLFLYYIYDKGNIRKLSCLLVNIGYYDHVTGYHGNTFLRFNVCLNLYSFLVIAPIKHVFFMLNENSESKVLFECLAYLAFINGTSTYKPYDQNLILSSLYYLCPKFG